MQNGDQAGAAQTASGVFDEDALLQRLLGDQELCRIVLAGFLKDLPRQVAALRERLAERDCHGAGRQAFALVGSAGTVSAGHLRELGLAMQQAAVQHDLYAFAELVMRMERAAGEFESDLTAGGWIAPARGRPWH
jgi:HPt (histidine-containing phosphotransfer) domain-containing protein